MQDKPITKEGATALLNELDTLKTKEMPRIIQAVSTSSGKTDIKGNAEDQAIIAEQSIVEERIKELESILSQAKVVDVKSLPKSDKVMFGTTVHLVNTSTNEECTYKIVGEIEADLAEKKISFMSPLAKAVIGKSIDDLVAVDAPGGVIEYEILDVEYK